MAKFERRMRVDLDSYESKWKGCYLVVALMSFNIANDFDKKNNQIAAKAAKLEAIENPSEEETQEYNELNDSFRNRLIRMISNQFREGKIYDDETNSVVDLQKEDIGDFDFQIIEALSRIILGKIDKKK